MGILEYREQQEAKHQNTIDQVNTFLSQFDLTGFKTSGGGGVTGGSTSSTVNVVCGGVGEPEAPELGDPILELLGRETNKAYGQLFSPISLKSNVDSWVVEFYFECLPNQTGNILSSKTAPFYRLNYSTNTINFRYSNTTSSTGPRDEFILTTATYQTAGIWRFERILGGSHTLIISDLAGNVIETVVGTYQQGSAPEASSDLIVFEHIFHRVASSPNTASTQIGVNAKYSNLKVDKNGTNILNVPMNEGDGNIAFDYSSNYNHLLLENHTWTTRV